jgi:hypothetical protein
LAPPGTDTATAMDGLIVKLLNGSQFLGSWDQFQSHGWYHVERMWLGNQPECLVGLGGGVCVDPNLCLDGPEHDPRTAVDEA